MKPASRRGSLLIVAMIFAAVLGIAITSYIQLARSNLNISNRSFYNNGAINLAEMGLEQAMWSINQMVAENKDAWTGWRVSSGTALRVFSGYAMDQNATGQVIVYIKNIYSNPSIVAIARVYLAKGAPVEKWIVVNLRKRSKFANGLVAKEEINFSGNKATVDSWKSDPDNNDATAPVPYSDAVKLDNGSVGSISVSVDAVLVQNADIWGYAATGGSLPSVGANGLVGPFGTKAGTMDMSRVSTDFSANFDPVTAPAKSYYIIGGISDAFTLPRVGDTPDADGKYYYEVTKVEFNNKALTIARDVVLKCTDGETSINIGGGFGALNIDKGASLEVYAPGSVTVTGQGILNGGTTASAANPPEDFIIWGTSPDPQKVDIKGNGVLCGVVYAPNGSTFINGNGDVCGSVVANDITIVGDAKFHYDESLADLDTSNPYGITRWNELTSKTERDNWYKEMGI